MASWFVWLAKCENVQWRSHVHVDCCWKVFKHRMSWAAEEHKRQVYSQSLCKNSEQKRPEDVVFCKRTVVSSSPTSFVKIHFFNGTKSRNKILHHRANDQNAFVSNLAIHHIQRHRKIRRRASSLFTILQCNISSQNKTKWSLMAIAQPTHDCAANRSSSLLVSFFLLPVKFFRNASAFVFVCFLKVLSSLSLHHVRQTAVSNLCSRTSFHLSQHENFFVVYLGNEISLTVYLSITVSFFLWGSQRKRLIYEDAIFVSEGAPMLYTLSFLTRFIPKKTMAVTQIPFSINRLKLSIAAAQSLHLVGEPDQSWSWYLCQHTLRKMDERFRYKLHMVRPVRVRFI